MTSPRRRILRSAPIAAPDPRRQGQLQRRRSALETQRHSLDRWMARLKRAFHAVEKGQLRVTVLERQIARLEQS